MNPELQNSLTALANKLGTSVEHLWPILVARERLGNILCAVLLVGLAVLCAYWSRQLFVRARHENVKASQYESDEMPFYTGGVGIIILAFIITGSACFCVVDAIYPEAVVIHSLVK